MNRTVTLVGARGGQGTSTVAAALALQTAHDVPTALLTHDPTATARLLGARPPAPAEPFVAAPNLTVAGLDGRPATVTIIDAGTAAANEDLVVDDGDCYAVVRGPCYLALATLVSFPHQRFDGIILVAELGRSLSAADASEVLGLPVVATVPVQDRVAQLLDAGLLAGRPDRVHGLEGLRSRLVEGVELAPAPRSRTVIAGRFTTVAERSAAVEKAAVGWELGR